MSTASAFITIAGFSGVLACLLTAGCRFIAGPLGMLDRPDEFRKSHGKPVPLLGGVAVCLAAGIALFFQWDGEVFRRPEAGIFVSMALFCVVGLWDDRFQLEPAQKLAMQVLAALPFLVSITLPSTLQLSFVEFPMGGLASIFVLLWILGATNSINLLDGVDGLAASVGIVTTLGIAGLAIHRGHVELVPICLILAGALSGFLVHNWAPARVFLGDAGSLPLGFALGALSLLAAQGTHGQLDLITPLILLTIPIADTFAAILRRTLTGRGIAEADRSHLHHLLMNRGWDAARTVAVIAGSTALLAAIALTATVVGMPEIGLLAVGLLLTVSIRLRYFGHMEARLLHRRWIRLLAAFRAVSFLRASSVTSTPKVPAPPDSLR